MCVWPASTIYIYFYNSCTGFRCFYKFAASIRPKIGQLSYEKSTVSGFVLMARHCGNVENWVSSQYYRVNSPNKALLILMTSTVFHMTLRLFRLLETSLLAIKFLHTLSFNVNFLCSTSTTAVVVSSFSSLYLANYCGPNWKFCSSLAQGFVLISLLWWCTI